MRIVQASKDATEVVMGVGKVVEPCVSEWVVTLHQTLARHDVSGAVL